MAPGGIPRTRTAPGCQERCGRDVEVEPVVASPGVAVVMVPPPPAVEGQVLNGPDLPPRGLRENTWQDRLGEGNPQDEKDHVGSEEDFAGLEEAQCLRGKMRARKRYPPAVMEGD